MVWTDNRKLPVGSFLFAILAGISNDHCVCLRTRSRAIPTPTSSGSRTVSDKQDVECVIGRRVRLRETHSHARVATARDRRPVASGCLSVTGLQQWHRSFARRRRPREIPKRKARRTTGQPYSTRPPSRSRSGPRTI